MNFFALFFLDKNFILPQLYFKPLISNMLSTFDSFDSIVNYLREPTLFSTVADSQIINNNYDDDVKPSKKQQAKEKDLKIVMNTTPPPQVEGNIQILPKGRVR